MPKNLILASTSRLYQQPYLNYLLPTLRQHFKGIKELLFIPFARPGGISNQAYTAMASKTFAELGIQVKGLHEFENKAAAIERAQGIFTGGGNTFLLLKTLQDYDSVAALRKKLHTGTPYLGTSAGSNLAGVTMQTTNDMPIVYPSNFKTLGLIDYNLNVHYLAPDDSGTHMGESRAMRIKEFHLHQSIPVIGLKEGSWLEVRDQIITLRGELTAVLFEQNKSAYEIQPNTRL